MIDQDLEDEIDVIEIQWEPTQTDPIDLWSGLTADWWYEVMKERVEGYVPFDEQCLIRAVVEALAAYLCDAGPASCRFVNELIAAFGNKEPSQRARAITTRIIADRVLMPLSRWPESEAVDLLAGELGLDSGSAMRVQKLAAAARTETGIVLHRVFERDPSTPALELQYEVQHLDYDTLNNRAANLRLIYLAQAKLSVADTAGSTKVSNPVEASDDTATRH